MFLDAQETIHDEHGLSSGEDVTIETCQQL